MCHLHPTYNIHPSMLTPCHLVNAATTAAWPPPPEPSRTRLQRTPRRNPSIPVSTSFPVPGAGALLSSTQNRLHSQVLASINRLDNAIATSAFYQHRSYFIGCMLLTAFTLPAQRHSQLAQQAATQDPSMPVPELGAMLASDAKPSAVPLVFLARRVCDFRSSLGEKFIVHS